MPTTGNNIRRWSNVLLNSDDTSSAMQSALQSVSESISNVQNIANNLMDEKKNLNMEMEALKRKNEHELLQLQVNYEKELLNKQKQLLYSLRDFSWVMHKKAARLHDEVTFICIHDLYRSDCLPTAISIFSEMDKDEEIFTLDLDIRFKDEDGEGIGLLREFLTCCWEDLFSQDDYFIGDMWKLPRLYIQNILPFENTKFNILQILGRLWI